MEYQNFRGIKKCWVITVLEGNGTKKDVYREVLFVYDENGNKLGIIDPIKRMKIKHIK